MTIGDRLKQARKSAKLTQIELAAKVGLKQSTLSDLECGKSIGSTSVAAIANALGVSALWLETGRGDPALKKEAKQAEAHRRTKMVLVYAEEEELLELFRHADERGQGEILRLAMREGGAVSNATGNEAQR